MRWGMTVLFLPSGRTSSPPARVSLDRTRIQVDGGVANLAPGIAITVEIKIGSGSIISYLLSPLLRYADDSLHEQTKRLIGGSTKLTIEIRICTASRRRPDCG